MECAAAQLTPKQYAAPANLWEEDPMRMVPVVKSSDLDRSWSAFRPLLFVTAEREQGRPKLVV